LAKTDWDKTTDTTAVPSVVNVVSGFDFSGLPMKTVLQYMFAGAFSFQELPGRKIYKFSSCAFHIIEHMLLT